MKEPYSHKEHKRHTFDIYCKKILRNEAINIQKQIRRQREIEVTFSDLSDWELNQLGSYDEYEFESIVFPVLDFDVKIKNELISETMSMLTEEKQQIILLSYYFGMTDKQIADILNLPRSTVQYKRSKVLLELKKYMEEIDDGNKKEV